MPRKEYADNGDIIRVKTEQELRQYGYDSDEKFYCTRSRFVRGMLQYCGKFMQVDAKGIIAPYKDPLHPGALKLRSGWYMSPDSYVVLTDEEISNEMEFLI